jgi:hypothetical protein
MLLTPGLVAALPPRPSNEPPRPEERNGRLDLSLPNGVQGESANADLLTRTMIVGPPAKRKRIERANPVLADPKLAKAMQAAAIKANFSRRADAAIPMRIHRAESASAGRLAPRLTTKFRREQPPSSWRPMIRELIGSVHLKDVQ